MGGATDEGKNSTRSNRGRESYFEGRGGYIFLFLTRTGERHVGAKNFCAQKCLASKLEHFLSRVFRSDAPFGRYGHF